jgi:predicted nucleic acid-binding protein
MATILVDTCVWLSLADPRDTARTAADVEAIDSLLLEHQLVMPWPVGFEVLRTRLARNRLAMEILERRLKAQLISWVDDRPYREAALEMTFEQSLRWGRALSMVDCLLRLMLDDVNLTINYLATWNGQDFADICQHRGVEIIDA